MRTYDVYSRMLTYVDVAGCSFTVRFSRFDITKSHIQGSGRGRARDTEFYYFENDGEDEKEGRPSSTMLSVMKRLCSPPLCMLRIRSQHRHLLH